jgi:hypothetical protein
VRHRVLARILDFGSVSKLMVLIIVYFLITMIMILNSPVDIHFYIYIQERRKGDGSSWQ